MAAGSSTTTGRRRRTRLGATPTSRCFFRSAPGGRFAAVTDTNGPGTRIPFRDVRLDGRLTLRLTVFYAGSPALSSPRTLAWDAPQANQQFRIDLLDPSAPIDSVASGDVLVNVFRTSQDDEVARLSTRVKVDVSRWAGRSLPLRLAATENRGPMRVGVDDIRFEPIDADDGGRIELPETPKPSKAIDLVLQRPSEADALSRFLDRAEKLARADQFTGAVLVARHGNVLLERAWGLADRKTRTPNTPETLSSPWLDEQDVHRGCGSATRRGRETRSGSSAWELPDRLSE